MPSVETDGNKGFRRIITNRAIPKAEPMVEEHIIQKYNKIYRIQMPKQRLTSAAIPTAATWPAPA